MIPSLVPWIPNSFFYGIFSSDYPGVSLASCFLEYIRRVRQAWVRQAPSQKQKIVCSFKLYIADKNDLQILLQLPRRGFYS